MKESTCDFWQVVSAIGLLAQAAALVVIAYFLLHSDVEIAVRGEIDAAVYGDVTTTVE